MSNIQEKTSGNQPEVIHQSKNEQLSFLQAGIYTVCCLQWAILAQICH